MQKFKHFWKKTIYANFPLRIVFDWTLQLVQNQPHLKLRNSLRSLPSYTCNTKKKVRAKLHV